MGHLADADHITDEGSDYCRSSWPGWRGRAREWTLITGLLQEAQAGRGAVLLVEGRSGIGKSRMLHITTTAAARAGLVLQP
ncbi:ATP-binding protein [Microbispora bryophytorum]|uniref:ATP-binding protein n=1 Tax=Microbispora bryophytorum TaxID=1460882 RepID=UPI0033F0A403